MEDYFETERQSLENQLNKLIQDFEDKHNNVIVVVEYKASKKPPLHCWFIINDGSANISQSS
jgi:hypothetical protein